MNNSEKSPSHYYSDLKNAFIPSPEEQALLILKGECPHNLPWKYTGYTSHEDVYECPLCGKTKFY